MQDKFITGDVPFDEWDQYVNEVETMNLEEYMDIQEAAFERYSE